MKRYQLRKCAGKTWLLDMEQTIGAYHAPVALNETAALILGSYLETEDLKKTAAVLQETYEIDEQEALTDVRDFLKQFHLQVK